MMDSQLYNIIQAKLTKLCEVIDKSDKFASKAKDSILVKDLMSYEMDSKINWKTLMKLANEHWENYND